VDAYAPSAAVLDHLRRPRHAGAFAPGEPGVRTGEAGDVEEGRLVRFELRPLRGGSGPGGGPGSGDGGLCEARFKAFGCAATIASASWLSEQVSGRPEARARALGPDEIVRALDLSPERRAGAELALRALRRALAAKPAG
jgi:nitrogen fixation NifU-like protein